MTRRKKYIIGILIFVVFYMLLNSWYQKRKSDKLSFEKPEFATVFRGNLEVPISATGSVEPDSRTEIKCKSSGRVQKIYFDAGDMVHKGDLLVELDPVDEVRSRDSAKAEMDRALASLNLAESDESKIKMDWPMQVQTALAALEADRATLQGAVLTFKRQDAIRKGSNPQRVTLDVVDPAKVKPVPFDFKFTFDPKYNAVMDHIRKTIATAEQEFIEAGKLVTYGKGIIDQDRQKASNDNGVSPLEYQEALITMWQAQAKLMTSDANLRSTVNNYILVQQAGMKVRVSTELLRQTRVALDQAEQRVKDTKVYAPQDGLVQEVFVREGQIISSGITTVTGGTPLMMLADVSNLFVEADVDEADIGRVRELAPVNHSARLGFMDLLKPQTTQAVKLTKENEEEMALLRAANNVEVTVDAFREDKFTGKVDRVYPNPKNINNVVTYRVRILLTSPNRTQLMLGMHANVKFTSRKLTNVLLVVNEAIKNKNDEHGVYIEGPDKKPMFIPVKVGLTDSTNIELKTDKLKPGDQVFTKLPLMREDEEKKNE